MRKTKYILTVFLFLLSAFLLMSCADPEPEAVPGTEEAPVVAVSGVSLDRTAVSLEGFADSKTVTASVTPENATNKEVVWESADRSVAVVSDGKISAVGVGETTVTATTADGNFSATVTVSVSNVQTGSLSGRTYGMSASGVAELLEGATVSASNSLSTYSTTTDANGNYSFENIPLAEYVIVIKSANHIQVKQKYTMNMETAQNTNIYLADSSSTAMGSASGRSVNASTGNGIAGITIKVRKGMGTTTGAVLMTVTTDSNGNYEIEELDPGNYTLEFIDAREDSVFGTSYINIVVVGGTTIANQNVSLQNIAGLSAASIRVVLTWGATPKDLDSHLLIDDDGDDASDYHVYYSNKTPSGAGAVLDVDDTDSYGPETTTITVEEGTFYHYYVYNFSKNAENGLSNSDAKVTIYVGTSTTPEYELYVPTGSGYYWDVFTYDAETGRFEIINTIATTVPVV